MDNLQDISKNFIPSPPSPILGREKEIEELIQLMEQHSVVTITGTGGIGKTRLAIELCNRVKDKYWDEVVYLSMATLTKAREVLPFMADGLGITEAANRTLTESVTEVLSDKEVVLVLDNLEHVAEAAIEISQLVTLCPGVKVLCTSRTPLKITAEQQYPLQTLPIPFPGELADIMKSPALELFFSRAKMVNKDFEVTIENEGAIIEICQYLDGLPLAIELAASRLRVITPDQLIFL